MILPGPALRGVYAIHSRAQGANKCCCLPLLTQGPAGSGKSAMAASVAIESEFPFVKVISPETLVGYAEQVRVERKVTFHVQGMAAGKWAAEHWLGPCLAAVMCSLTMQ